MKKFLYVVCLPLLFVACTSTAEETSTENTTETAPLTEVEETTASTAPYFIHLSDIHLNTFAEKCDYGEDTGNELWALTQEKVGAVLSQDPAPTFVVYTGDLPAHYSCENPTCFIPKDKRADHNQNLQVILTDLRKLVADNGIPFFYMPGNNDALAGDYYSFADAEQATPFSLVEDPENPFPAINASQPCGDPPCMVSDPHPTMGYYAARPEAGLRLIALNSIILGRKYHEVDGNPQVEAGNAQMSWLSGQLREATAAGEKVYIAMHIPPGNDAYGVSHGKTEHWMWAHLPSEEDSWLNQFLAQVDRNQGTIAGMLYGHTHMDEVRRLYSPDGSTITEVAISAPGITPQHDNNPGFRKVWYDAESKELTDFETFYTQPGATSWGTDTYKFSEIYGCPAGTNIFECLSGQSLEEVNTDMDKIFTVMNGAPSYATESGIDVKTGQ